MKFTVAQIAEYLNGEVDGDPTIELSDFGKIEEGARHELSFLSNMKYESYIYTTQCGAVLVNRDFQPQQEYKTTLIRVDDAYASLAKLLELKSSNHKRRYGIEEDAYVHKSATVDDTALVCRWAYVAEGAVIGKNVVIHPFAYIGRNVVILDSSEVYTNAVICDKTKIGKRCIIHSGAIVGADGFGFAPSDNGYSKIPQTGHVCIEDDVEVGANACIDRAVFGATKIGRGVKIDNLVQVAHNVEIGANTVIAAQTGIAGSTKVGSWNMIGGQVGIAGHLTTASKVTLAAQTGVISDVKDEGVTLFGSPAMPISKAMRGVIMQGRLPEMNKELNALRQKVEELTQKVEQLSKAK